MLLLRVCAAAGVCAAAAAATSLPPPPPGPWGALTFFDDFSGGFNASKWAIQTGPWRGGVYLADNVEVADGLLLLHTRADNVSVNGTEFYMVSGAVNTQERLEQAYGRFEVSAQLPVVNETAGFRLHSSVWLVNVLAWAQCPGKTKIPEIDILELDPTYWPDPSTPTPGPYGGGHFHAYFDASCTEEWYAGDYWLNGTAAGALSTAFHTWGLSWTPTSLAMDLDGVTLMNVTASQGSTAAAYLAAMTDPLYLLLTSCIMERVPPTSRDVLPQVYQIDWVRAFAYDP